MLRPISIWQPQIVAGEPSFVRPDPGPFPDHWAVRSAIPLRSPTRYRLCLLGESTAAGYLLAPEITPAGVLARLLGTDWDVVDLARTNERIDSLAATAEAALQLRPDAFVVFAGNNWNLLETPEWSPFYPSASGRRRVADALGDAPTEGGYERLAEGAARDLRRKVESLFASLDSLRVPVTVVVPEVNLRDWHPPHPVPWLPGHGIRDWYRLFDQVRGDLAAGRWDAGLLGAREMLALDGGICPTPFGLLGRALEALEHKDARPAYEAQADCARYPLLAQLAAPQARVTEQILLREQATLYGFPVVDLPRVFGADPRIPGRELFYDYCHLTVEGIDRLAAELARAFAVVVDDGRSEVSEATLTAAAIGAAVHGVHRGARGEIVRHWLRVALETSRDLAESILRDLVETRGSGLPALLTPGQLHEHVLSPQHGWRWVGLDAEVIAATREELGPSFVESRLGRPRIELWNPLDRFLPETMDLGDLPRRAMTRAPWPRTDLALVTDGPCTVDLVLRGSPGTAHLDLAGRRVASLTLEPTWSRHRLQLSTGAGLHRLSLQWPFPAERGEEALERIRRDLDRGKEASLHPVFGEIYDSKVESGY